MTTRLLLVDYENVHRVDLSPLDESYSAIVFLGASQNTPKALADKRTQHKFKRVTFRKVSGNGKNALDFHIAFELGRVFATSPKKICFVVSRDKGFDPLMMQANRMGLNCRRVNSFDELIGLVCGRCNKDATIDHNGGRWCSNCGDFAVEPDRQLAPVARRLSLEGSWTAAQHTCGSCRRVEDMASGLYDDGEWMCGGCATGSDD